MSRPHQRALALLLALTVAWAAAPREASAPPPMVELSDGHWVPLDDLEPGDLNLRHGDRVEQIEGSLRLSPPTDPLSFGQPLDLNRASAAQLQALPGVGPALSARIVGHRESQGPFATVAALEEVRGIGPATRVRLQPWVTAGAP